MIETIATYVVIALFLLALGFSWRDDEREKRRHEWRRPVIGRMREE